MTRDHVHLGPFGGLVLLVLGCAGAPAPTGPSEAAAGEAAFVEAPQISTEQALASATSLAGPEPSAYAFEIRLGAGDLIGIEVFGLPELDREVRVAADGTISLPLLGRFSVASQTIEEAAETIENVLIDKQLVNEPEVSVTIKDSVSSGVSVQGAVKRPGTYQLTGPKTVLEILLDAGGLSASEDAAQTIFLLRRGSDGEQVRTEIDAEQLLRRGDVSQNLAVRPGDVVLVPEARTYRIYVSGAVRRPGAVSFKSSDRITLLQAITAAGGPTERANLGKVQVIRRLSDGQEERSYVNVKKIRKGKLPDVQLQRNDTVVVDEWFF